MSRPSNEDIQSKVRFYLNVCTENQMKYSNAKKDIESMSYEICGNLKDMRDVFFSGWVEEDFRELLRRLNEAETILNDSSC